MRYHSKLLRSDLKSIAEKSAESSRSNLLVHVCTDRRIFFRANFICTSEELTSEVRIILIPFELHCSTDDYLFSSLENDFCLSVHSKVNSVLNQPMLSFFLSCPEHMAAPRHTQLEEA